MSKWMFLIACCVLLLCSGNVLAQESTLEPTPEASAPIEVTAGATATVEATAETTESATAEAPKPLPTVFLILMENHDWSQIVGSRSAPYINDTLLKIGAHADQYYNPPGLHPSEPNYIWLEAGTNLGIHSDADPTINHVDSTAHLTALLDAAGVSWKSYPEGIDGKTCPLVSYDHYGAKHNPMIFFDDVTNNNDRSSANCIAHVRPYSELAADLASGNVAHYNFIVPDLCDDMHNSSGCATKSSIQNGDTWLSQAIPPIMASDAYKTNGVIMITWDEGEGSDGPIGMIVLSPFAKPGYENSIHYTHSSTLRTLEEMFGVKPFLGDAANATDLSDLFTTMP